MKFMRKTSKYLFFILLIATFFYACKSPESLRISLEKKEKEERIRELLQHAILYDTFSGSLKLSIKPGENSKSSSVDAYLKIKKNQAIELSLRVPIIGMEVAKVSITPEQILIIDRINKQYFRESMNRIQEEISFDFDYYSLQALLTNHLFIAGKATIEETDFNSFQLIEDEFQAILNNTDSQGINYDFATDYTRRILHAEMYKEKSETNLIWVYRNFGLASNNRLFPMQMNMALHLPDDTFAMNFSFNRVDINEPFIPNTAIPNRYQQISLEQVVKLIKLL
jgi:hypothetical protein